MSLLYSFDLFDKMKTARQKMLCCVLENYVPIVAQKKENVKDY